MVATIVLGLMLLGAWAYTITHDQHGNYVQQNSRGLTAPGRSTQQPPEFAFVGRVTGMKDCRWSDPNTATSLGASVSLNRKYALSSGLLEIAYASGAKVILEGPCDYVVESDIGGFLSLGKLTARVESAKPQAVKTQAPSPKTQNQNPKSPSSLIPHPSSLFSVRTPTAVVTDLGTEFGVEVNEEGNTTSHVFRGSVRVEAGGGTGLASGTRREAMVLRENESVRVEKGGRVRETHQEPNAEGGTGEASGTLRFTHPTTPPKFVRRLVEPPKLLDLLDIIAGGNGTGHRRERGIDPTTGLEDPVFFAQGRTGNPRYWPTPWNKMVDGVLSPDGRNGAVQVDSAGHTFDGFPETTGIAWGSIWSRAADTKKDARDDGTAYWVYALDNAGQFMPERRGLLCMTSNEGITFDLAAMRRAHPGVVPERFRASAGMADLSRVLPTADGMVDLWVLIDGRLKLKRDKLRISDGAIKVDVELAPSDRFLTLAVTDAGNGYSWDWFVFGDPALDMAAIAASEAAEDGARQERSINDAYLNGVKVNE